jgi:hypothetical protein
MNHLILNRWIVFMLLITGAYVVYMVKGDKPFLYPYFWRTLHYVLIWGALLGTSIIIYSMRYDALTTMILWTFIIFFGVLLLFNLLLANLDDISFKEKINLRVFSLLFAGLEGIMLAIIAGIELLTKWIK